MKDNYPEKEGNIVDIKTNKIVGKHTGISKYTIGQRRGLNIGGKNGFEAGRWFVIKKDIKTNTLFVSCGDSDEMFCLGCVVKNFNWIIKPSNKNFKLGVKLRYRQPDQETNVELVDDETIKLIFKEKQN